MVFKATPPFRVTPVYGTPKEIEGNQTPNIASCIKHLPTLVKSSVIVTKGTDGSPRLFFPQYSTMNEF